ncbi:Aste57867_11500 [Aphanomyces stellatus]|uniref:Aste57867_11500 protein n=1 Tax=Aphanomyces stellatus TaxID=120398 RepID=A0A485KT80_9STRA|nr:hypothetical protein As57867_011457 [Aphanomyces stellatus]VFT88361.1 Aste57867_11500 [Aphanomyces stellatus]
MLHWHVSQTDGAAVSKALATATPDDLQKLDKAGRCVLCAALFETRHFATEDRTAEVDVVKLLLKCAALDVNFVCERGMSPLLTATQHAPVEIVQRLCSHPTIQVNEQNERGQTALIIAAEKYRVDILDVLLQCPSVDVNLADNEGNTALLHLVAQETTRNADGDITSDDNNINRVALDICNRPELNVNHQSEAGNRAFYSAIKTNKADVVVALLASENLETDIDHNMVDEDAISYAFTHNNYASFQVLLDKTTLGPSFTRFIYDAVDAGHYELVGLFYERGLAGNVHTRHGFSAGKLAIYVSVSTMVNLLVSDLPVQLVDGHILSRESNTWGSFLDVTNSELDPYFRFEVVRDVLNHPSFTNQRDTVVRALSRVTDTQGRTVLHMADIDIQNHFNECLYFCGRYEIFERPPIHISATSVVVQAYDHGVFKQLFSEFATSDGSGILRLRSEGLVQSMARLGASTEDEIMEDGFSLTEWEFERFCRQKYVEQSTVAIKFMRNKAEYDREIQTRRELDPAFVVTILAKEAGSDFRNVAAGVTLPGGLSMATYPNIIVMPAADRSLEDIFLKEKPDDNKIRAMVQDVAKALCHMHDKKLVHGDLKKLNILRVQHQVKLTDMDAAVRVGQPIGAKFSSGVLPPEMFYKLKSDSDTAMYTRYWHTSDDTWRKMKPRGEDGNLFVVRAFHTDLPQEALPYSLRKATTAHDAWALGCLLYQMYTESELVPTDRNQDIEDEAIERAATWSDETLKTRIHNKIQNPLARDLIQSLLVVDPASRMDMRQVLAHPYFQVAHAANAIVVAKLDYLEQQLSAGFDSMAGKFDQVLNVTRESISELAKTKEDVLRGIFQATEVHVPTSFVILPFNILDKKQHPLDAVAEAAGFLHQVVTMGTHFMDAVKANQSIGPIVRLVAPGMPLYLYLIDEVAGTPVVPDSKDALYPIKIDTKSPDYVAFVAATMPFIQTGFKFLQGLNTVAGLLKSLGVPSLDNDTIDAVADKIDQAAKTSSVFDFEIVQAAVEDVDGGAPVERIRGAALRQLVRFFDKVDADKDFAGLQRTYAPNGQAVWTTPATVQALDAKKPTTNANGREKGDTAQAIYLSMVREPPDEKSTMNSSLKSLPRDVIIERIHPEHGPPVAGCTCLVM